MSKFNAKNLSYGNLTPIESNEPSFLRKLRGEYGAGDARHERPIPRPRKMKNYGDNEDDEPTYVVEESQDTLSKEEYEALMRSKEDDGDVEGKQKTEDDGLALTKQLPGDDSASGRTEGEPIKEQVAAIGAAKKKRNIIAVGVEDRDTDQEDKKTKPTKAKKGKKVKLSFDDAS